MDEWESYVLGAFGILIVIASVVLQIAALVAGRPWTALTFTVGILGGAALYRTGYRLLR